jgi:hypothetical protein
MTSARWRWILILMVVVVAGCQPPPPGYPASLLSTFSGKDGNPTFTAQTPPAGGTGQDVVAAIRARAPLHRVFDGRAVPVFGVVDCYRDLRCQPGPWPGGDIGGARTVWLVLYPDCIDQTADSGDFGWVLIDAVEGVNGGSQESLPCELLCEPGTSIPLCASDSPPT